LHAVEFWQADGTMSYILHLLTLVALYSILALSLDLVVGQAGLMSLAHAALYGVGAYVSVLLVRGFNLPPVFGLLIGMAAAAGFSLLLSLSAFRLQNDYFVLATFGFQMIFFSVLNNWIGLTHGALGLSLPSDSGTLSRLGFAAFSIGLAGLISIAVFRIANGPFGRVLRSLREGESFPEAFGKNTRAFKATAFAASAALAALAGALYADYSRYIEPSLFTADQSILILSMVIIGGPGRVRGPLLGAALLVVTPELLRFIGLPGNLAGNVRQILYGSLLVLIVRLKPDGLLSARP